MDDKPHVIKEPPLTDAKEYAIKVATRIAMRQGVREFLLQVTEEDWSSWKRSYESSMGAVGGIEAASRPQYQKCWCRPALGNTRWCIRCGLRCCMRCLDFDTNICNDCASGEPDPEPDQVPSSQPKRAMTTPFR